MVRFYYILLLLLPVQLLLGQDGLEDTLAFSIDLDEYVITAEYEPTHYQNATHRVQVVTERQLQAIGATTVDQVASLAPSIRIYNDPILGKSIRMRGVGASNVAILIDGVPVIGRNDGAIDISQLSLHNVERIEIVEGPVSNIYGSNAAGGVINLITKKKQKSTWQGQVSSQLESIGQQNYTANLGWQQGPLTVSAHGRYFSFSQYPIDSMRLVDQVEIDSTTSILQDRYPFNPKIQVNYGGRIRYAIDPDKILSLSYDRSAEEVIDYDRVRRARFNPYGDDRYALTDRTDLTLSYRGKHREVWHHDISLAANRFDRRNQTRRYLIDSSIYQQDFIAEDSIRFDQLFSRATVTYTGWDDWTVRAGYNYVLEAGSGERLIDRDRTDSLRTSAVESSFFGQVKYMGSDRMEIAVGGRHVMHNLFGGTTLGSIHARYKASELVSLRASYAQGYRNPTLKELYLEFIDVNHNIIGNVDLAPERSQDVQVTVDITPSKHWSISTNLYGTHIDDRIILSEYEPLKFEYDNVDHYNVIGIQPEVRYQRERLSLSSSWSFGYWSTAIDAQGAPDYGAVTDCVNTMTYELADKGWSLMVNHRWVGRQLNYRLIDDVVRTSQIDAYHLVDLSMSKTFLRDRVSIVAGIRNLGGIQQVAAGQVSGGAHSGGLSTAISPGRSFFVNATYSM